MKIFVQKVDGVTLPQQAHPGEDAAYDLVATSAPSICGFTYDESDLWLTVDYIEYKTNLYLAPQDSDGKGSSEACPLILSAIKYHTELFPRSSISKRNLLLANSVALIDNGYRNEIVVRFKYYFQPSDLQIYQHGLQWCIAGKVNYENIYQRGDKIVQLKVAPNIPIEFEWVDALPASTRDKAGWGSSGR